MGFQFNASNLLVAHEVSIQMCKQGLPILTHLVWPISLGLKAMELNFKGDD